MSYEKIIHGYFEKVNSEKLDDLLDFYAGDGEFKAPGLPVCHGREEIRKFYTRVFANYPEHMDYPLRVFENENSAAVEIKFEGKSKNGNEIVFDAVDIFDFSNGKIKRITSFFDNYEIMKKLGLLK